MAVLVGLWLVLSVWGVVGVGRRSSRSPTLPPKMPCPRCRWLGNWGGWIIATSVASIATGAAPDLPLWGQLGLVLGVSVGLLRVMHALDTLAIGTGVVAGLGLIALWLDSLSGGSWARACLLGHGGNLSGVDELCGTLALLWSLLLCRAWLQIEGNPLGVAYLVSLVALWLGWKGLTPALGWGATLAAILLSLLVLQRELTERRRVRLATQSQPMRAVRISKGADVAVHGGLLLMLCGGALWLSGLPQLSAATFSAHEAWFIPLGAVCALGLWRARATGVVTPLPPALQYAWLVGTLGIALLGTQPAGVAALGLALYWALIGTTLWQETLPRPPNLRLRTGGNE